MFDALWLLRLQSFIGLIVFLAFCFGLGMLVNRRRLRVPWRTVAFGIALQLAFALLILKTGPGRAIFAGLNEVVKLLLAASEEGAALLFGDLARGMEIPVTVLGEGETTLTGTASVGAFFAFNVLPTIIFFSALLAILYHTGVMTLIVGGFAWLMRWTMRTSGAETLSAAANIFVGQTEAPLFVRPFLPTMTRSELNAVMVGGFANIASGVLGVYAAMLSAESLGIAGIQNAGSHLLAASVISAPAGLVVAKLLVPETETPETAGSARVKLERTDANLLDAAVTGTRSGLVLAANVGAVLMVFTGLVYLVNEMLALIDPDLSLQSILGVLLWPVAWLCGAPAEHCRELGSLIGIKTVLNEFFGYLQMASGMAGEAETGTAYLSPRTKLIALYAICGFANFASVGIQIGGIGVLAPNRRRDVAQLGFLAMIGGTIASLLTACVVGMIV